MFFHLTWTYINLVVLLPHRSNNILIMLAIKQTQFLSLINPNKNISIIIIAILSYDILELPNSWFHTCRNNFLAYCVHRFEYSTLPSINFLFFRWGRRWSKVIWWGRSIYCKIRSHKNINSFFKKCENTPYDLSLSCEHLTDSSPWRKTKCVTLQRQNTSFDSLSLTKIAG